MFRHTIPIGRIFGIAIDLDYSWFLIVGLLAWMLAVSYFPSEFGPATPGEYWAMGFLTAIMLFVSVLIHELGHSVVAQAYGLEVPRITLFLFGGVSQIAAEPPSAGAEFWIALVGPLVSFALAAFFWEIEPLAAGAPAWFAVLKYLALLNLILALFNLVPGFPLDGGRVLRSIVWKATGAYQKATSAAALTGRFFGFLLIFWGVWEALRGAFINGLWIAFIGWYLESAAGSQLQIESVKMLVGHHRVREAMRQDFVRIPSGATLQQIVDQLVTTQGWRSFVVSDGTGLRGLLTLADIQKIPRDAWPAATVAHAMVPADKVPTAAPETELWTALEAMGRENVNQMPVMDQGEVIGMLSREDILHYLEALQLAMRGRTGPGRFGSGHTGPPAPAPTGPSPGTGRAA